LPQKKRELLIRMATIIKSKSGLPIEPVIYRFEDANGESRQIVDDAKAEAAAIIAEAHGQADGIRHQAEQTGRAAGQEAAKLEMQTRLQSLLPAIASAAHQLGEARQAWLQEWQSKAVQLAVRIAERIVRREIERSPSITLAYVREALEMCAAAPQVRVLLNCEDAQFLGESATQIVREIVPAAHAEIVGDVSITYGGCRIETRHGEIDQRIETQLRRIEAELSGG
jgi:flagellar biosynthesis/type III secretory pathway protein FliH